MLKPAGYQFLSTLPRTLKTPIGPVAIACSDLGYTRLLGYDRQARLARYELTSKGEHAMMRFELDALGAAV